MRLRIPLMLIPILLLAAPAQAVQIFTATLNGSQQVPPNDSAAIGSATLVLSDDEQSLSYSITTVGLDFAFQTPATDDDVIGMHIHNAPIGENGPVAFGFINPSHDTDDFVLSFVASTLHGTITGVWDANDAGGNLADFVDELRSNGLYINVHTNGVPGGEIRGQIVPEPGTTALMILGLTGLAVVGRPRREGSRSRS